MDDLENKLGAILGNPEMMEKIMGLAQNFSGEAAPTPPAEPVMGAFPEMDPGTIAKIAGMMQRTGVDKNQQQLLHALIPYLSKRRIDKLERAMRAARLASLAGSLLGSGTLFGLG